MSAKFAQKVIQMTDEMIALHGLALKAEIAGNEGTAKVARAMLADLVEEEQAKESAESDRMAA